jgi:hypothetical protein
MTVAALIEQLKTIPDWRRGRKVQYPLWLMLLMSLLGVMSGYSSLRGLEDFMQRHEKEVPELFALSKAKLPRYATLREMAQRVDVQQLMEIFIAWAKQAMPVQSGQVVSLDGKALGSILTDGYGAGQDFVSVVSACLQQGGWVIGQVSFQNGKTSEIASVRQLLQQLEMKGVWVTLDALHTQKNGL